MEKSNTKIIINIKTTKIISRLIIVGIFLYIIFWIIFLLVWKISHQDVNNAEVYGVLYNEKMKPLPDKTLFIENFAYDGWENIGEYKTREIITIITNKKGKFNVKLRKSAFICINAIDENGDTLTLKSKEVVRKKLNLKLKINEYKTIGYQRYISNNGSST